MFDSQDLYNEIKLIIKRKCDGTYSSANISEWNFANPYSDPKEILEEIKVLLDERK